MTNRTPRTSRLRKRAGRGHARPLAPVLLVCLTACGSTPQPLVPESQAAAPPAVLLGASSLHCDISSRENGHQKLELTSGSGIAFDAIVSPIVDGTMSLLGEREGGEYRFTSHLAESANGELSGVGAVTVEELETRVTVALSSYRQQRGPGTAITFTSTDMANRGMYVEFLGAARAQNGDRYAFRVNLGAATRGSGQVSPANANRETEIMSKVVSIEAPMTTSVVSLESRTTVQRMR